ncbi:putative PurR-regulated permease PerM [Bacillus mesophilus]|uniref:AI-2E family transporter n=1 Tax=Bacillus mesophilus TaxID=1808955 RepID=A0A6M0Q603_9BACI|nr:AI-2E family transporter [Bacillus mesophilus]MBM7660717.1 putative PurR-regulated permease PerM [Bacillus mesophilus]NEY71737.1 AI-2E family transporter [Bacillus mesophilus]
MKNINTNWLIRILTLLLFLLCIYVFLKLEPFWTPIYQVALAIFIPFLIASFITYLLHPLIEKIHAYNIPRPIAILIIYGLFFGGIALGLYKGLPQILIQIRELGNNVPELFEKYRAWSSSIHQQTEQLPDGVHARIEQTLTGVEESIASILTNVINVLRSVINYFLLILIIPFIVFYMLKDFDQIKKTVWYLTPRNYRKSGIRFLKDIDQSLGNYIRGQLLVCLVVGIISTLGFWLIDMKYPLLLGVIVGVTNVIPYFGPIIGAIPAMLIAVTISGKMVLFVAIVIFSIQFIEGNLLSPLIVGKSLHMHPVFIMFALLAGGEIGGVAGLILAVPLLAILKVILLHAKAHFTKH